MGLFLVSGSGRLTTRASPEVARVSVRPVSIHTLKVASFSQKVHEKTFRLTICAFHLMLKSTFLS